MFVLRPLVKVHVSIMQRNRLFKTTVTDSLTILTSDRRKHLEESTH